MLLATLFTNGKNPIKLKLVLGNRDTKKADSSRRLIDSVPHSDREG